MISDLDDFFIDKAPSTRRAYRVALDSWANSNAPLNARGIRGWFSTLSELSASTRNLYLSAVESYLRYCGTPVDHGIKRPNPNNLVSPTRALSDAEVRRFMEEPVLRWRCAWSLLFYLGLRRSEVAKLARRDIFRVDGGRLAVRLTAPKDGKYRELLIPMKIQPIVEAYIHDRTGSLFRVGPQRLSSKFRERAVSLGLGNLGPHCARATFVTRCLVAGWSYAEVQRVTGHSNQEMVARYDRRRFVTRAVDYD